MRRGLGLALLSGAILLVGCLTVYSESDLEDRLARAAADKVVFVGEYAYEVVRTKIEPGDDSLAAFEYLYEAYQYLEHIYQPGDVVFLKGNRPYDHLRRLWMARQDRIRCWRQFCKRFLPCEACPLRMNVYIPGEGEEEVPGYDRNKFKVTA